MKSRGAVTQSLDGELFDVLVIGGGINGSVSALNLSSSGLSTLLIDKGDFASETSQQSSSLAWGGIKYLESGEFSLVWQLCHSRNELMRFFPSQVKEIRFFTKLEKGFRKPRFFIFLGTLVYWLMGRFTMRPPRLLSRKLIAKDEAVVDIANCQGGVEYSDCYFVDTDTRFVFNLIKRATQQGARAVNYLEATRLERQDDGIWRVEMSDQLNPEAGSLTIRARSIVNAAGPYADSLNASSKVETKFKHVFSKGVHLIVPKITSSNRVLTFFADDGRMFFVIPMGECSCIGTTDTRVEKLPAVVSDEDRHFILSNINKRLKLEKPLMLDDVISERCGVRPLAVKRQITKSKNDSVAADWMSLSRKHVLEVDEKKALISIFGGKLTDCLNVGREVFEALSKLGILGRNHKPSAFQEDRSLYEDLMQKAAQANLSGKHAERLWRRFQEDAFRILDDYAKDKSLLQAIQPNYPLTWGELVFAANHEMVESLSDLLRRRTNIEQDMPIKTQALRPLLLEIAVKAFGEQRASQAIDDYLKTS